MRLTKEKAAENHARVIDAAARLFREKGFDGVGVAELMGAAGLTHGGFYNHFDSKEAVEAAACRAIFDKSVGRIAAVANSPARERDFVEYRRRYVSREARDASAANCPMVAFAGDVSRQSKQVREVYAEGLRAYLEAFTRASGDADRRTALRAFSELVGALTLARSVANIDPDLSDEILDAVK